MCILFLSFQVVDKFIRKVSSMQEDDEEDIRDEVSGRACVYILSCLQCAIIGPIVIAARLNIDATLFPAAMITFLVIAWLGFCISCCTFLRSCTFFEGDD